MKSNVEEKIRCTIETVNKSATNGKSKKLTHLWHHRRWSTLYKSSYRSAMRSEKTKKGGRWIINKAQNTLKNIMSVDIIQWAFNELLIGLFMSRLHLPSLFAAICVCFSSLLILSICPIPYNCSPSDIIFHFYFFPHFHSDFFLLFVEFFFISATNNYSAILSVEQNDQID